MNPGERELWIAILAVCVAGALSTVVLALFNWSRIGRLRDALGDLKEMLQRSQPVELDEAIREVEGKVIALTERVEKIEEGHRAERRQFADIGDQLIRRMDALQEGWDVKGREMVLEVAAQIRNVYEADVRRIVRHEFFATKERADRQDKEARAKGGA